MRPASSPLLALLLLCTSASLAAPTAPGALVEQLAQAARDRKNLQGLFTDEGWTRPATSGAALAERAAAGLTLVSQETRGGRAVLTVDAGKPPARAFVYALETSDGWRIDGWDDDPAFGRFYLAGTLPVGWKLDQLATMDPSRELMKDIGQQLVWKVGGNPHDLLPQWLEKPPTEAHVAQVRKLGEASVAAFHVSAALGVGAVQLAGRGEVTVYLTRPGDAWAIAEVVDGPVTERGLLKHARVPAVPPACTLLPRPLVEALLGRPAPPESQQESEAYSRCLWGIRPNDYHDTIEVAVTRPDPGAESQVWSRYAFGTAVAGLGQAAVWNHVDRQLGVKVRPETILTVTVPRSLAEKQQATAVEIARRVLPRL